MTRLRQTVAKRLKEAQEHRRAAHHLQRCRHERGDRGAQQVQGSVREEARRALGFMGFFAKAACLALKDVPAVNAMIEGDEIVYHNYVDISVAVRRPMALSCR
jgi:2-oxoglutarate dehydrogenase E2 component (dihydrolipoamide succinyltransferase)